MHECHLFGNYPRTNTNEAALCRSAEFHMKKTEGFLKKDLENYDKNRTF